MAAVEIPFGKYSNDSNEKLTHIIKREIIYETNLNNSYFAVEFDYPESAYIARYDISKLSDNGGIKTSEANGVIYFPTADYQIFAHYINPDGSITFSGMRYSDTKKLIGTIFSDSSVRIEAEQDNELSVTRILPIGSIN
jgi:hypothetical protein